MSRLLESEIPPQSCFLPFDLSILYTVSWAQVLTMESLQEKFDDIKSQTTVTVRPVSPMMLANMGGPRRFHDDEREVSSAGSSVVGLEDAESRPRLQWCRNGGATSWRARVSWFGLRPREGEMASQRRERRRQCCRWAVIAITVLTVFGVIAGIVYISFVTTLIRRLAPPAGHSGLQHIVEAWKEPDSNGAFTYEWRDDFSRDIIPKSCHSHNDYWRPVPLYMALAAGCVSFEADIWLTDDSELLVSHSWKSTRSARTLRSLYLDPLTNIFTHRNISTASTSDRETGVFDSDPNASTILLIDFKSNGTATWPVLLSQLQPLRDNNWLTYFNGTDIIPGPLTIVGTGNASFDLINANSSNRFIFFDAPLLSISDAKYNTTNSFYASTNLKAAVGSVWGRGMSGSQFDAVKQQVQAAEAKGLKSRYWDTPGWPVGLRDGVWRNLMDAGVGVLNVDALVSATSWNWGWCVVAGIALCGHS
ncbi:hypothetical protein T440DRAFT_391877 [Plenodomus tracheiphilus IPT5]|uniref:Altered inheritance of mitochondria protein 6 n=1 Tax=Plenodomus tracheiphilus IPT5 TaxID=1408161 RepID=A0A6A7BC84_9PLEO|nr:hypothetical protein T440DRAFT_391877 [Plenodomus tracheiphilus IPT5]